MMRVAVMQPYFYPYMGYFRLIAAVDLFVLFDCVQFPRRGRVHRAEVPDGRGGKAWFTLPLARAPRETRIDALRFAEEAEIRFAARRAAFPWLAKLPAPIASTLAGPLDRPVVDYLERNLRAVADLFGLETRFARSSSFGIAPEVRRGARVRAVASAAGATHYLNAPGGRSLYEPAEFAAEGLTLEFLGAYDGPHVHMLHALASEPIERLAADAAAFAIEPT